MVNGGRAGPGEKRTVLISIACTRRDGRET